MRRSKLRNKRPKALFGEVAAAGIQAAATLAAAGIQARQMASSAKEQANAQIQGAQMQAKSIEQTNQNNNTLQQQSQQFIASENEANRQLQRDWQMNMQLAQGMLTSEDRRAESRIQVKKGGKVRRSNKGLRDASFPLQGRLLGARFTDGTDKHYGVFLGYTPEGYPKFRAEGDKHSEYHEDGNKLSSGIGFKIPGQDEIEVEDKEVVVKRPTDYIIFSNVSRNGLKPSKLIESGMPTDEVLAFQEATNQSRNTSPVRNRYAAKAGAYVAPLLATGYPVQNLNFDMVGPNTAYLIQRPALKRGGRVKAAGGFQIGRLSPTTLGANWLWKENGYFPGINVNGNLNNPYGVVPQSSAYELNGGKSHSNKSSYNRLRGISGNLWGAGLTTLGNLGGAWLTSWGANRASKYLSKAYTDSADILAGAYDKLQGVDMSSLKREDFAGSHYMPVVQSVYQNVNPQLENTNREFRRLMRATNAGTLSTAARLSRQAGANSAAAEQRSAIYADQANRETQAKLQNTQMINEAAAKNAEMDIQASRDFTNHYVDLLKYNADIANERITGRAQAVADGMLGAAGARGTAAQATGQAWGAAIQGAGQAFGNAIAVDTAQRNELDIARMSATRRGELSYLKRLGTPEERDAEINRLYSIIGDTSLDEKIRKDAQNELLYLTSNYDYNNYRRLMNNYGLIGSMRRSLAAGNANLKNR